MLIRERQTERQRLRHRGTDTDRETEKDRDWDRERQRDRDRERQRGRGRKIRKEFGFTPVLTIDFRVHDHAGGTCSSMDGALVLLTAVYIVHLHNVTNTRN